jgi:hypothetical protein
LNYNADMLNSVPFMTTKLMKKFITTETKYMNATNFDVTDEACDLVLHLLSEHRYNLVKTITSGALMFSKRKICYTSLYVLCYQFYTGKVLTEMVSSLECIENKITKFSEDTPKKTKSEATTKKGAKEKTKDKDDDTEDEAEDEAEDDEEEDENEEE